MGTYQLPNLLIKKIEVMKISNVLKFLVKIISY